MDVLHSFKGGNDILGLLGIQTCKLPEEACTGRKESADDKLRQMEADVQGLHSSALAAGPAAFRLGKATLEIEECQHIWAMCLTLWEACFKIQTALDAPPCLRERLQALARDLFDIIQESGQLTAFGMDFLLEMPRNLLRVGRNWIEAGDRDSAEWFISNALQLQSLCMERLKLTRPDDGDSSSTETWQAAGLSAHLLQADILLSSLQLAIDNKQKALQANLLLHLKLLARAESTPLAVCIRVVHGMAGLHIEAAIPLATERPSEAVRMLQQAHAMVSEQQLILRDRKSKYRGQEGEPLSVGDDLEGLSDGLDDVGLQILRLLLTCLLNSGGFSLASQLASAYLSKQGFLAASEINSRPAVLHRNDGQLPESQGPKAAGGASNGSAISWDIWLMSVKARVALSEDPCQLQAVVEELQGALGRQCGLEVVDVALRCMLQPFSRVQQLSEGVLEGICSTVQLCVKICGKAAADEVLMVVECLIAADEEASAGDVEGAVHVVAAESHSERKAYESPPTFNPLKLEAAALMLLADDDVQAAILHKKARCHAMLHTCGATQYLRRNFDRARRLFIAALHYASQSSYSASARLVAASSRALGMPDSALAYLDLAEQQDPDSCMSRLQRFLVMIGKGENGGNLYIELQHVINSPDFELEHFKCIITEAMCAAKTNPDAASLACRAVQALRAKLGPLRQHSATSWSQLSDALWRLTRLDMCKIWLQAWMIQTPLCQGSLTAQEAGESTQLPQLEPGAGRGHTLEQWLHAAIEELFLACSELGEGSNQVMEAQGTPFEAHILWMAETAMRLGLMGMNAGLWQAGHGALLCCLRLCRIGGAAKESGGCGSSITPAESSTQSRLLQFATPAACTAAHALLQMYRQLCSFPGSRAATEVLPHALTRFLRSPASTDWLLRGDGSVQIGPPLRGLALVDAAKELLVLCKQDLRPALAPQGSKQQQEGGDALVAAGQRVLAKDLESLEFCGWTYLQNQQGQKLALQSLLSCPGLSEADLEPLAKLCLERRPWQNIGMACAVLGFVLRTAQQSSSPDYAIMARAIRTLYQLSSSDAVKFRVCERALAALGKLAHDKGLSTVRGDSVSSCGPAEQTDAASEGSLAYPASELHWLWASCLNKACIADQAGSSCGLPADQPSVSKEGTGSARKYMQIAAELATFSRCVSSLLGHTNVSAAAGANSDGVKADDTSVQLQQVFGSFCFHSDQTPIAGIDIIAPASSPRPPGKVQLPIEERQSAGKPAVSQGQSAVERLDGEELIEPASLTESTQEVPQTEEGSAANSPAAAADPSCPVSPSGFGHTGIALLPLTGMGKLAILAGANEDVQLVMGRHVRSRHGQSATVVSSPSKRLKTS